MSKRTPTRAAVEKAFRAGRGDYSELLKAWSQAELERLEGQRRRAELLCELARALADGAGVTTTVTRDGLEVRIQFREVPR